MVPSRTVMSWPQNARHITMAVTAMVESEITRIMANSLPVSWDMVWANPSPAMMPTRLMSVRYAPSARTGTLTSMVRKHCQYTVGLKFVRIHMDRSTMEPNTVANTSCWMMSNQSVLRRSMTACASASAMLNRATHVPYESCVRTSESV